MISEYDYRIAIPTYNRAFLIKEKTIGTLQKLNVDPARVTIFVADDEQRKQYEYALRESPYQQIVVGVPKLPAQRNFIQNYYSEGTRLVQLDDDIDEILRRVDEKNVESITDFDDQVVYPAFKACEQTGAHLWGTYAVNNPFFMSDKVAVGLYFCIGVMWGHIIRHDDDLILNVTEKEDYQRTLQYFTKDGCVCRLNNIHAKSVYLKTPGGIEYRTPESNTKAATYLTETYPELCTMYIRESTGRAELRLRDGRKNKPVPIADDNIEQFF